MNKTLTVFTPTYNRAYILSQLYESLLRQTSQDFVWLIIDDGSTDNTNELVKHWQVEADFEIQYIYQNNQGMHGAHNTAYKNIKTELNVCIDSDDFMPDDAVASIIAFWKRNGTAEYAGFIALDAYKNGKIIGTKIPETLHKTTLTALYRKHKVKGDKKLIYRTEIITQYPDYPLFENEKYVSLAYKYLLIDQDFELLTYNKVVCIVDYLPDGSSVNMFNQYWKNPLGFAFIRKTNMKYNKSFLFLIKENIHYISSSIIAGNKKFIKESPYPILTFLCIPLGVLFYFYIKYKVANNKTLTFNETNTNT